MRHSEQRGYNLVELMVAITLSTLFVGAVLLAMSSAQTTGRSRDAHAQLSEDGLVAVNLIARQLRMVGFRMPTSPLESVDPPFRPLFGCLNGFTSTTTTFDSLACATGTGSDAIAIRYDAREPGVTVADCLNSTVTAADGVVDNRFYVATAPSGNPALYCRGNGGGGGQPLIDNVETLQLRYGVAGINTATPPGPVIFDPPGYTGVTARYVRANDLTAACGAGVLAANAWCGVVSVRICVTLRSEDNRADAPSTPYVDCDGNTASVADRRLRYTLTSTIALRNQAAGGP